MADIANVTGTLDDKELNFQHSIGTVYKGQVCGLWTLRRVLPGRCNQTGTETLQGRRNRSDLSKAVASG